MELVPGYLLALCTCSVVSLPAGQDLTSAPEKDLVRFLLSRYELEGKAGRPVARATDTIEVKFGLSLVQILDVDEKDQVLKTNIWYHYEWRDILLQWAPSQHDNITSVRLPSDRIWLPDIRLYNFADDRLQEAREALVVVSQTGHLQWWPQAILNSSCTFDVLFFPFDRQTCSLKFGSWTYNGHMLNIDFMDGRLELDLSHYIESNEWQLVAHVGHRNVKYYSCCSEPFPDLTFTLKLKRKIAFYTIILILPCVLLSSLTLVIFWVPPENGAKLQLGMNIFLAFFVLLLVLSDLTPTSALSTPLIGAFYCLSMVMIAGSTVLACVVANMHFRGIRVDRAPGWLRSVILDGAARVLNVGEVQREWPAHKRLTHGKIWSSYVTSVRKQSDPETLVAKVLLLDRRDEDKGVLEDYGTFQDVPGEDTPFQDVTRGNLKLQPSTSTGDRSPSPSTTTSVNISEEAMLLEEVTSIRELLSEELVWRQLMEESNAHIREWRMIAAVMDRIFFFFYVVVNFMGLFSIFLRSFIS